ncbi:MAG: hypothetical protein WB779_13805 [Ignavibacteriaceae bacterium]|jgi:hypothetical protein
MLQTEPEPSKTFNKKDTNPSEEEFNNNSETANNDPTLLSQRNNQKLNSIIEEVRDLLESDSEQTFPDNKIYNSFLFILTKG